MSLIRGSGKGGAGASIAEDMYFASTAERDQFTTDNPSRIFQGVTCAIGNTSAYEYYQYDMTNTQWRDANLIFQGKQGEQGDAGDPTLLIDDESSSEETTYSSSMIDSLTESEINDEESAEDSTYSSSKIERLIDEAQPEPVSLGFTLDADTSIAVTDSAGESANAVSLSDDVLVIGSDTTGINIKSGSDVLINDDSKVTTDKSEVVSNDLGLIEALETPFTGLPAGKYYIKGWTPDSLLPDWEEPDQDAILAAFGNFGADEAGGFWILASKSRGIYSSVSTDGEILEGWFKLNNDDQAEPLEASTVVYGWTNNDEVTVEDIEFCLTVEQTADWKTRTEKVPYNGLASTTFIAKRTGEEFKNFFVAHLAGFFDPEPFALDWGIGTDDSVIIKNISYNGKVGRSYMIANASGEPSANNQISIPVKLVQGS